MPVVEHFQQLTVGKSSHIFIDFPKFPVQDERFP